MNSEKIDDDETAATATKWSETSYVYAFVMLHLILRSFLLDFFSLFSVRLARFNAIKFFLLFFFDFICVVRQQRRAQTWISAQIFMNETDADTHKSHKYDDDAMLLSSSILLMEKTKSQRQNTHIKKKQSLRRHFVALTMQPKHFQMIFNRLSTGNCRTSRKTKRFNQKHNEIQETNQLRKRKKEEK